MFGRKARREAEAKQRVAEWQRKQDERKANLPIEWAERLGPEPSSWNSTLGDGFRTIVDWIAAADRSPAELTREWATLACNGFSTTYMKYRWQNTYPPVADDTPIGDRLPLALGLLSHHVWEGGLSGAQSMHGEQLRPALDAVTNAWGVDTSQLVRAISVSSAAMALVNGSGGDLSVPWDRSLLLQFHGNDTGQKMCTLFRQTRDLLDVPEDEVLGIARSIGRESLGVT